MSDKLRCINAFEYDGRIYPGGLEVDEDAAILETHRAHFVPAVPVTRVFTAVRTERATANPDTLRSLTTPVKRGPGRPRKDANPPADTKPAAAKTSTDEKTGD